MTIDTELETWRQEWRGDTEPLPDLKRKIRRQNVRMILAAAAMVVCLAVSTSEAVRTRGSFMEGLATGIWLTALIAGSYAWWVRRGAWEPAAQTTLGYLELSYKRSVANARTLRFSFYFLLATIVLFAASSVWNWREFRPLAAVVLAALVAELFFLGYKRRRSEREIEKARKLIEQTRE